MTSKQVLLCLTMLVLTGCAWLDGFKQPAEPLVSPYATRRVWAIVPLLNQSGSLQPDGAVIADHLQRQLATAANLNVLPVNRTLAAMTALNLPQVTTPEQALALQRTIGADGLILGVITAYDPYDPPKLGLTLELYADEKVERMEAQNLRQLTTAASSIQTNLYADHQLKQPVSIVSAVFNAGDPAVRDQLQQYAVKRGAVSEPQAWHRYRISMDLYAEFVSYVMSWRLLDAERQRLAPPPATQPAS